MKNFVMSKRIIGAVLLIILLFAVNVYAADDSFKTTLTVDNSQVKRGENVIVTIALSDIAIESGEKGIGAYTASIDFDSSILEYVSTSGTDKWEAPLYQETKIVGNTNDGEVVKTAQNIGTITFKVKEDAKLGETTIKLTNFSGSTASTDVSANDSSVKVTILDKDNGSGSGNESGSGSQNGSGNGSESGGITGNQSGNGNGNSSAQKEKDNNIGAQANTGGVNNGGIRQGILPQTGDKNKAIYMVITICALVAISLFVRIKLLKYNINIIK